jgi:hypothetical protein
LSLQPFTLPPTRSAGGPNPPADMNQVVLSLNAGGGYYSVMNAAFGGGADPTGVADSTSAINAAIAALPSGGGTVWFPAGTFKVSGPLTLVTGTVLQGAGENATVISQTSTSADTLSMTDLRYITVRDLQLSGPSSGTGRGVAFLHSASALAGINLENVIVGGFGGDGVHIETPITSVLTAVRSQSNGGNGFTVTGGTSVAFQGCYANANTANGFELDSTNYMALDACASDSNVIGYSINGSSAVVMNGCGSEACTDGFKVLGASANITMLSCKVLTETGIAFWITGSSVFNFMLGCREASPGGGATASFQVDSGSTATVIDPQNTTATNYAAGTTLLFQPTNFQVVSSGSTVSRFSRGATSNSTRLTLQDAGSDRWTMSLEADNTDNWHLKDLGHTLDTIVATYQATQSNLAFLTGTAASVTYGGGTGVTFLATATTAPSSNPSGGALLYTSTSGTLTTYPAAGPPIPLSGSGMYLAAAQYAPASHVIFTTTSTAFTAVASGTVTTGAFTAPSSGIVLVNAAFTASNSTNASAASFALAAHGTTTPLIGYSQQMNLGSGVELLTKVPFLVTGLTSGSSYTFDLMWCVPSPLTASLYAFGNTSTAPTLNNSTLGGPVVMTVQAV